MTFVSIDVWGLVSRLFEVMARYSRRLFTNILIDFYLLFIVLLFLALQSSPVYSLPNPTLFIVILRGISSISS